MASALSASSAAAASSSGDGSKPPTSVKEALKNTIKQLIIEDAKKKMRRKYSLIVADSVTIKILHHCFKMHELNDLDIGVVVNVSYPRERVKVSPIYFLSGSHESVTHMVKDYEDPSRARYSAPVHAYFCSPLEPRSLKLVQDSQIARYLGTFSEVHCDFLVFERRVFTLNRPQAFRSLYFERADQCMDELSRSAQQLVGVCLSLKEEPYIRYSANSKKAHSLAQLFDKRFTEVRSAIKSWAPADEKATLIILDRTDDVLSPLLHDLTFQPMVMDLLHSEIDDPFSSGPKPPKKEVAPPSYDEATGDGGVGAEEVEVKVDPSSETELESKTLKLPSEDDEVWIKYRHMFFGDVLSKLKAEFDAWREGSAVAKFKDRKSGGGMTGKDLLKAAQDMPQYKAKIKQYNANVELASRVKQLYIKQKLLDIISLEQDIAAGINGEGRKTDRPKITKRFSAEILNASEMDMNLKLRMFLVYLIAQGGIKAAVRRSLMEHGGFDDSAHNCITNLATLGVTIQSTSSGAGQGHFNKDYWHSLQKHAKSLATSEEMIRYIPYLQWIVDNHLSQSLDKKYFPWITEPRKKASGLGGGGGGKKSAFPTSFRRHKKTSTASAASSASSDASGSVSGPKVIVFVLGGASYSELRLCYDLSTKYKAEIYVGSTHIISPQGFVDLLSAKTDSAIDIDD